MTEVFKLKEGEATYDDLYKATVVAEAKAEDEEEPVVVCRKLLNTFEPVVKIFPDGSQERLDD